MAEIKVINWDVDQVWYKGISTSHCAKHSKADPRPYIKDFVENRGWFTYDDVNRWSGAYNEDRAIDTISDAAKCLTDFLYKMKKSDGGESVITKQQTIEGKQALLKGLSLAEVKAIAESIEPMQGLLYAIDVFKENKLYQVAFSDGLGPFVSYYMKKYGMDHFGYPPALVEMNGEEVWFELSMIGRDDVKLTGKVGKFKKADAFLKHIKEKGYDLSQVAIIDDSGSNAKTMGKVQDAGGIAVAFRPTAKHRKTFNEAGIPILRGEKLEPFVDIVLFYPEKIGEYCE